MIGVRLSRIGHLMELRAGAGVRDKAESLRLRYLYRDLVLRKKIRLPVEGARALVGPDCAYHLYSLLDFRREERATDERKEEEAG